MPETTCCFVGHREIVDTQELREQLYATIEQLIVDRKVDTFLFGSKSQFNSLCYELVTKIKEVYPYIKRVYVRAEFSQIDDSYKAYLLECYEDTCYPEKLLGAGRAVYVERNYELIEKSAFCVFYYQENYITKNHRSGTELALRYAVKRNKNIITFPQSGRSS